MQRVGYVALGNEIKMSLLFLTLGVLRWVIILILFQLQSAVRDDSYILTNMRIRRIRSL